LDHRSNQLANYLKKLGVAHESRVGICVERGLQMIVGLLGILKAGAAYVPLDPVYPGERLSSMVHDAGISVLLTQAQVVSFFAEPAPVVVKLDENWKEIAEHGQMSSQIGLHPENLAYMIYTSGSTGKPKAVMVEHRQLRNQLLWAQNAVALGTEDCVLQKASYSFDASILEIFLPLACGARIVIAEPERYLCGSGSHAPGRHAGSPNARGMGLFARDEQWGGNTQAGTGHAIP
jgi:microcystin synthetase protein McyA